MGLKNWTVHRLKMKVMNHHGRDGELGTRVEPLLLHRGTISPTKT